jgi:Xaa-Pro dipeptidase
MPNDELQMTNGELGAKTDRLVRIARDAGLRGIVLATHHNIAWLTAGRSNRVDGSRETGTARLLVTADGRRFVLANAIEMPRMLDEVLAGFDFEPLEYPWTEDQDPARAVRAARTIIGEQPGLGADWPLPDTTMIESAIARARTLLTPDEVDRYRALGRDAGRALGGLCQSLSPGEDEREIARSIVHAAAGFGARAVVALVGADERLRKYRHPLPTRTPWKHVVMLALCAERDGIIVSLSRVVAVGGPADLDARTRATASVFGRLLAATRPGATGAQLYAAAVDGYAAAGYAGEELKHHQGGAIGYRAREWVAHPLSQEVVQERQAFAWNPTVTGTKVEDTALVVGNTIELITSTPDWPAIPVDAGGVTCSASGVWRLN